VASTLTTLSVFLPVAFVEGIASRLFADQAYTIVFALGASGFALFNNLLYLALGHTSAVNVSIEQAAMPLVVFILNFALFRIRTTAIQAAGFLFTLIGVTIIITGGNPLGILEQNMNAGDLIMIAAVIVYGGYTVALGNKPQIHWLGFMAVLGMSAFVASLFFTLLEWLAGGLMPPDRLAMGVVVYVAVFPSIIAQLLWVRGMELIGSNRGGVFINLVPIFGSLFAVLTLGEQFRLHHGLSLALVTGGVAMAQSRGRGALR